MKPPRVLIIAGSDSGGGAGIQADIKTVTMLGGFAMTAITTITAQNTLGVQDVMPVPAEMVIAQIDSVLEDIGVDAIKIGMIGSPEIANAVADFVEEFDGPIIFDPVMAATSGATLADEPTIAAFERLMRWCSPITPNWPELGALAGARVSDERSAVAAAQTLRARYGAAVLAKGGHAETATITDVLVDVDGAVTRWTAPRIDSAHTHGTGCTLASAIAVGRAHGLVLHDAVVAARDYVRAAMLAAPGFGAGNGPMGHALGVVPFELIHRKDK
jgi:hydroxymethylpyrimidine/phosphomethylpyrimidine kinase